MNNTKTMPDRARVMAIINITPDSFFSGSRTTTKEEIQRRVETAIAEGADIIDLGGCSTRPYADEVPTDIEFERVDLAFGIIRNSYPNFPISVDTFRSGVVSRLHDKWGAFTVNDISAGDLDQKMIPLVGKLGLPYIAMHSRGNPQTMQSLARYEDVVEDVYDFFVHKIQQCAESGVEELIIDPGFGFAKTVDQNFALLGGMHRLCDLGYTVLAGLSRKTMIWRTLDTNPANALNGTTALNWEAMRQGAKILRVHDVREAVEVTKIFHIFERNTL